MGGPTFRPDIQDNLLRLMFDRYRINLLKVPREDFQPGQALLAAGGDPPVTFGPVSLARLIPGVTVPAPSTIGARMSDLEATHSNANDVHGNGSAYAPFLERFLPEALLPSMSARAEANGARKLFLRFTKATRDAVDILAIGQALGRRDPDLSFIENADALGLYVVTEVFRCPEIEMSWRDDKGRAVDAEAAITEAAKLGLGGKVTRGEDGAVRVTGDASLAFGVRLIELVPRDDGPGRRLKLEHTKLDVLSTDTNVELGTADPDDYTILADPWSGSWDIVVRPSP